MKTASLFTHPWFAGTARVLLTLLVRQHLNHQDLLLGYLLEQRGL